MMMWKIVGASKASVLYIYIDEDEDGSTRLACFIVISLQGSR